MKGKGRLKGEKEEIVGDEVNRSNGQRLTEVGEKWKV